MKKHYVNFYPNIVDGGYRAVCQTCTWSAADEDLGALKKRASGHDLAKLPDIPKTVPFQSGLKKDLWS